MLDTKESLKEFEKWLKESEKQIKDAHKKAYYESTKNKKEHKE